MGRRTQLYIDRLYLSWKNYVPRFLTFLFHEDDFYVVRDPEEPECPSEIGFSTMCSRSIEVLERNGYTVDFFAEVYDYFEGDLNYYYEESTKREIVEQAGRELGERELSRLFAKHLDGFPFLNRVQELYDFIKFLKVLLSSDFVTAPFNEPVRLTFQDGRQYEIAPDQYLLAEPFRDVQIIHFENLQMYVLHKSLKFPPWIIKLCGLFDPSYLFHYPEVISLMFVRLALESVDPASEIKLDLSDIVDVEGKPEEQEREIRAFHAELAYWLVEKVNLYNSVFRTLFRREDQVREQYIKAECRDLLKLCDQAETSSEKGRTLEQLTEVLFTSNHLFELVDKRVSTGDEEIDLVVKNSLDRPFWNALNSPLFFIECKNWSKPVGAREMRDFEGKLRNHSKLVKVGFFVSINGFTSEVRSELKRASRDAQHVVLLTREDIEEYILSGVEFFSWLEKRAATFY